MLRQAPRPRVTITVKIVRRLDMREAQLVADAVRDTAARKVSILLHMRRLLRVGAHPPMRRPEGRMRARRRGWRPVSPATLQQER